MKNTYNRSPEWLRALMLSLLLLTATAVRAQVPAWQMGLLINTTGNSGIGIEATTTDASNNVYITGHFIGTVTVGSSTLTSVGYEDVFVAKWSSASSSFVWAKAAGGAGFERSQAIAVNGANVYIGGYFRSATSGNASMMVGSTALTGTGGSGFVAKLTDVGAGTSFTWAYAVESPGTDGVNALALNGSSLYVAGYFGGASVSFGSLTLAGGAGDNDALVAKLTDTGGTPTFNWAQRAGNSSYDEATAIVVNGPSVYVTGVFSGVVAFGSSTLVNGSTSQLTSDAFVAKLTDTGTAGSWNWAQQAGGGGYDRPVALARNGNNLYVAGNFSGPSFVCGGTTLVSANAINTTGTITSDVFIAKLVDAGSTGSIAWAQQAGSSGDDRAYGLEASGGSLFVAGIFDGAAIAFGSTVLTRGGQFSDLYLAKLVDAGSSSTFSWAQQATGQGYMGAYGMTLRGNRVYVAGFFNGGTGGFGSFTLTNTGVYTSYIVSITDATLTATTASLRPESIGLFPNPAHGRATVQLPATSGPATLTILDALGRTLRTQIAAPNTKTELDLTGLAPGLYAVRVQAGNQATTQRLVVE